MMKTFAKYILPLALLTAALSSCRKDSPAELGESISFRADAPAAESVSALETKAVKADNVNIREKAFGVYGGYSAAKGAASTTNVFDNSSALKVSYNSSTSYWEYTRTGDKPKYYWKRNQYYRIRAYHPYDADVAYGEVDKITIRYRIIDHDYDLLVAFATRHPATDSEGTGRVQMNFQHALSALRFRIAFNKDVEAGTTDTVTEFHLTGIHAAGTLSYTHEADGYLSPIIDWATSEYSFDSTTEFYKGTTERDIKVYDDTEATLTDIYGSSDADNVVFAIPQTCSDPRYGDTYVHFKTKGGGDAIDHSAKLPELKWEPGKIYTYNLLIAPSGVEITVTIKDWNEVQSTVDIKI